MKHSNFVQQGYVLLVIVMILVTLSVVPMMSGVLNSAKLQKSRIDTQRMENLLQVKAQLLFYAQSVPEIYSTDTNGNAYPANLIPGPGYLPCPDTDNDGIMNTPCGMGNTYAVGRMPVKAGTRLFSFMPQPIGDALIWYAVDSRYVIQNTDYHNGSTGDGYPDPKRYAPLNTNSPGAGVLRLATDAANPLVVVLLDAGDPLANQTGRISSVINDYLEGENADGDNTFSQEPKTTSFNDLVVTISLQEWQDAVTDRLLTQKALLCNLDENTPHWFNRCHNDDGSSSQGLCPSEGLPPAESNPVGCDWRTTLGCP